MRWEVGQSESLANRSSTSVGGHLKDAKVGGLEIDYRGYRREITKCRPRRTPDPIGLARTPCLPCVGLAEVVFGAPL